MSVNLHARSLLTLLNLSALEIDYLLSLGHDLKEKKRMGTRGRLLAGKNIALIFDKPSTRTRCAFETAISDEGGWVTYLANSHMGYKESLEDTAKVLGRMYDGIGYRGYRQQDIETLARHAGIPVWNGLTDQYHPTQILADFMTIQEYIDKPLHQVKIVYVGDTKNNVARSLMIGAAKMRIPFIGLAPRKLWPEKELLDEMHLMNSSIQFEEDIAKAIPDTDVIYTDTWVSMGEEDQLAERIELLNSYQVNHQMLAATGNDNVIFMHCLPAFHDRQTQFAQQVYQQYGLTELEVTDEVFRSRHSLVFEQAENRLHSIKAVIVATIGKV